MNVHFKDEDLERLATDRTFAGGRSPAVVNGFRKVVGFIKAATDERDFYGMRSLRFEKLSGARKHQRSMRINDQYRLIIELATEGDTKAAYVVGIEDYH